MEISMLYHWDWESTISSSKVGNENNYLPVDCVIVGTGINSLYITRALATKHGDVGSNVIVTNVRDSVKGNHHGGGRLSLGRRP